MINIAVCDEETACAQEIFMRLCLLREKYGEELGINSFVSVEQLYFEARKTEYDYLILSVSLSRYSAFSVAEDLTADNENIRVFFICDSEEQSHFVRGVNPAGFICRKELKRDIENAAELLDCWISNRLIRHSFFIDGQLRQLCLGEILLAESSGNYMLLHMQKGIVYKMRMTVYGFMEKIPEGILFQVNSGCIVNLMAIKSADSRTVTLKGGRVLGISRGKYKELKKRLSVFGMGKGESI